MRRLLVVVVFSFAVCSISDGFAAGRARPFQACSPNSGVASALLVERFSTDPTDSDNLVLAGAGLDRVSWDPGPAAWLGDHPGSAVATYDASAAPGLFGFRLAHKLDQNDVFSFAALIRIRSEGFVADPNGFFQISFGLWNSATTGLDRTGDLTSFAGDTFDLVELDWFPNVSPFFGGPYLSPSVFGAADTDSPAFPALGSFANASFAFGPEAPLPLDQPLLAIVEHRPDLDAVTFTVQRIVGARAALPVQAAAVVVGLAGLPERQYTLDSAGLTLWRDGFGGDAPAALQATVELHGLVVRRGLFGRAEEALQLLGAGN